MSEQQEIEMTTAEAGHEPWTLWEHQQNVILSAQLLVSAHRLRIQEEVGDCFAELAKAIDRLVLCESQCPRAAGGAQPSRDDEWRRTVEWLPEAGVTVLTWHEDDLVPVAAARIPGKPPERDYWARQIEGPEDAAHSPGWNEPLLREPTYWHPMLERPTS